MHSTVEDGGVEDSTVEHGAETFDVESDPCNDQMTSVGRH